MTAMGVSGGSQELTVGFQATQGTATTTAVPVLLMRHMHGQLVCFYQQGNTQVVHSCFAMVWTTTDTHGSQGPELVQLAP